MDGRKSGDGELTGIGPGKSGVHVAFGIEAGAHRDHVGMNAQHIGDHLGGSGFVSLTLRAGADRHYDFAIDIEFAVRTLRIAGVRQRRD